MMLAKVTIKNHKLDGKLLRDLPDGHYLSDNNVLVHKLNGKVYLLNSSTPHFGHDVSTFASKYLPARVVEFVVEYV